MFSFVGNLFGLLVEASKPEGRKDIRKQCKLCTTRLTMMFTCFACCWTQDVTRKRLHKLKSLLAVRSAVDRNTLSIFSDGVVDVATKTDEIFRNELITSVFSTTDISNFVSIVHLVMLEKSLAPQCVIEVCKTFILAYPMYMSDAFRREMVGSYHPNLYSLYLRLLPLFRSVRDFQFLIARSNDDQLFDIFEIFIQTCEQNAMDDHLQTIAFILVTTLTRRSYDINAHVPDIIRVFGFFPSIIDRLSTDIITTILRNTSFGHLTEFVRILSQTGQPKNNSHLTNCVIQVCLISLSLPNEQLEFILQVLQGNEASVSLRELAIVSLLADPNNNLHLSVAVHFLRFFYAPGSPDIIVTPDVRALGQRSVDSLNVEVADGQIRGKVAIILGILMRFIGRIPTGGIRDDIRHTWNNILLNPNSVNIGIDQLIWENEIRLAQHIRA